MALWRSWTSMECKEIKRVLVRRRFIDQGVEAFPPPAGLRLGSWQEESLTKQGFDAALLRERER